MARPSIRGARILSERFCEVCHKYAMWHVNDLQITQEQTNPDSVPWQHSEIVASHLFCDRHARQGYVIPMDKVT